MEIFYRYLGGPRTFWGRGNSTTIINNNFMGPIGRPIPMMPPHYHCFGGGYNLFNFMAGFSLLNSFMQNVTSNYNSMPYYNNYLTPSYNNSLPQNNYDNYIYDKINTLEDNIRVCEKEISDLKKAGCTCKTTEETKSEDNKRQANKVTIVNKPESEIEKTDNDSTSQNESPSAYSLLKKAGLEKLDKPAQDYINSHITEFYTDDNGTPKYDITAVVHDGDTLDSIIKRFYTENEKANIEVTKSKFHTQNSETAVTDNPLSGDTLVLKEVSEFGLKALMEDAKNGITREGEIIKTNKRISDLKTAFINGENKLSKAYVIQNHIMSENEYNKIISQKYS